MSSKTGSPPPSLKHPRTGKVRERRVAPRVPVAVVPGSLPEAGIHRTSSAEPPHAHAVCRVCGRIAEVRLTPTDRKSVEELALRRPAGWTVDDITVSFAGACRSCQEGRGP